MTKSHSPVWVAAAALAVAGLTATVLAGPPKAAAKPADSTSSSARTAKQIEADLAQVATQIHSTFRYADAVKYNPRAKRQMGSEGGPMYAKEADLYREMAGVAKGATVSGWRHMAMVDDARLAFWGVSGAQDRLDAAAADADPVYAADAKLTAKLIDWWGAYGDAAAQGTVIDDYAAAAKAAPTSGAVATNVRVMVETNPADVATGHRLNELLTKDLGKTIVGKAYAAVPNKIDEPLVFDGKTLQNKTLKSADFKGKVVLVDFWATWCPPCREEIPHVAKLYAQYHDQGFEVVGVSSDNDRQELTSFLKQHTEMPWPELFAGGTGWHPLTKKYGINSIPTMYLLDRNGVLRTVEGREEMDKMIPELLEEKAGV